jgi:hypothetical protein
MPTRRVLGSPERPAVAIDEIDNPGLIRTREEQTPAAAQMPSIWSERHNPALVLAAAGLTPTLYLLFVARYATNSFTADDWSVVPMVHAALHDHLSLGQIWDQHTESRFFIGNLIEIAFGFLDGLDLRAVMFLSAAFLVAAYIGLLLLLRRYLGGRVTPIAVLAVGVTWFSLADVQNALWAFQVSWYLTVLLFIAMLVAFCIPNEGRALCFSAAILVAIVASLTAIQGFICWPVGLICILWGRSRSRRLWLEIGAWTVFMAVTIALYLPGYSVSEGNICLSGARCSEAAVLLHPVTAFGFLMALMGNVIPQTEPGLVPVVHDVIRFEVLGAVLFATSLFILVQSWRHRGSRERLPLPLLLIVFSLLFDAIITLGRSGAGTSAAITSNRYVMPNLILLTGIVIYGLARIPRRLLPRVGDGWMVRLNSLAFFVLAAFVVLQVTSSTSYGVTNGSATRTVAREEAQFFVNQDRSTVNNGTFTCELELDLLREPLAVMHEVTQDQLGEFQEPSYRYYRALGPWVPPACRTHPHGNH